MKRSVFDLPKWAADQVLKRIAFAVPVISASFLTASLAWAFPPAHHAPAASQPANSSPASNNHSTGSVPSAFSHSPMNSSPSHGRTGSAPPAVQDPGAMVSTPSIQYQATIGSVGSFGGAANHQSSFYQTQQLVPAWGQFGGGQMAGGRMAGSVPIFNPGYTFPIGVAVGFFQGPYSYGYSNNNMGTGIYSSQFVSNGIAPRPATSYFATPIYDWAPAYSVRQLASASYASTNYQNAALDPRSLLQRPLSPGDLNQFDPTDSLLDPFRSEKWRRELDRLVNETLAENGKSTLSGPWFKNRELRAPWGYRQSNYWGWGERGSAVLEEWLGSDWTRNATPVRYYTPDQVQVAYSVAVAEAEECLEIGQQELVYPGGWVPLGVFGLLPPRKANYAAAIQLAVDSRGVVRGYYVDAETKQVAELQGGFDRSTLRLAWSGRGSKVFEISALDLLQRESVVNVYNPADETIEAWEVFRDVRKQSLSTEQKRSSVAMNDH